MTQFVRRTRTRPDGRQTSDVFAVRPETQVARWFTGQGQCVRVELTEATGDVVTYEALPFDVVVPPAVKPRVNRVTS